MRVVELVNSPHLARHGLLHSFGTNPYCENGGTWSIRLRHYYYTSFPADFLEVARHIMKSTSGHNSVTVYVVEVDSHSSLLQIEVASGPLFGGYWTDFWTKRNQCGRQRC